MLNTAKSVAEILKKHGNLKIVSHIDADGIASGSIASASLKREGIEHSIDFVKQLDENVIMKLKNENPEIVWFTDLGSGMVDRLDGLNAVITDHHKIQDAKKANNHLNPHLFGKNGAVDISGSGLTYLVAKNMNRKNIDLSALAVVGAVGDMQDSEYGKLIGTNRTILQDGKNFGVLDYNIDIRFFGRETRPVFKLLQYANDPIIPGLTGREGNCIKFLQDLGVNMKDEERWRKWIDLSKDEKRRIVSKIVFTLLSKGFGHKNAKRVIGEVYTLSKETPGTELHDAKEFATLLNSCGRYDKTEIGYSVCLGDRGEYLQRARTLLQGHRRTLVDALQFVNDLGITKRKYAQYFHAKGNINEKVVGIVAGMLIPYVDKMPLIAFADAEDGVKVSARTDRSLVEKGLDLSIVMNQAAKKVGGIGGGHNVAAGATIPKNTEEEFLDEVERIVKGQMKS
jgi:RecJ-like exonuclease